MLFSMPEGLKELKVKSGYKGPNSEDYGILLYSLVRAFKPTHCLEIGTAYGYSAICIAQALKDNGRGGLLCIDREDVTEAAANVERSGLKEQVALSQITSQRFFQVNNMPFEFIHVDGDHSYGGCAHDLLGSWSRLKDKGVMVVHDTVGDASLRQVTLAVKHFLADKKPENLTLPVFLGCTVLGKGGYLNEG